MTDRRDRAWFLRRAGAFALALSPLVRVPQAFASTPASSVTPDAAIARLLAGNARFVSGHVHGSDAIVTRRGVVAPGQSPFAVILTCADSRVAPEYVFDQRLGDIFVVRVAGNVLDADVIGSIEYAVAHFHAAAVVVLGHERCGAVTDAVELAQSHGKAPGDIQHIVDAIDPAVHATKRGSLSESAYIEAVIRTNTRMVASEIPQRSASLRAAVLAGKLKIVPAVYSLDTGKTTLL